MPVAPRPWNHDELLEQAKAALNAVFGDRSVGPETTRDSLLELREEIGSMLDALDEDSRLYPEDM